MDRLVDTNAFEAIFLSYRPFTPEQRLLDAILRDAANCLISDGSGRHGQSKKREALQWFMEEYQDDDSYFSFPYVCEYLKLSHTAVRRALFEGAYSKTRYRQPGVTERRVQYGTVKQHEYRKLVANQQTDREKETTDATHKQ